MMKKQRSFRSTIVIAPALLTGTVLMAALTSANAFNSITYEVEQETDYHQLCFELGLTPEAMAALGMQGHQVSSIFESIDDQSNRIASLRSLETQLKVALPSLNAEKVAIRRARNPAEQLQLQAQIDQIQAEVDTVSQGIRQTQAQLRQAILPENISTQYIEQVCAPSGNAARLPVEFRFTSLEEHHYTEIHAALAQERRANANSQQPDTHTQLLLSGYRNLPAVAQARSNLLYNLDAVRIAFND